MGFKYKKFEVRDGEVIEPTRIRENMRTLAHEFNGSLDRENLPIEGVSSDMINFNTFNFIKNSVSTSNFSTENQANTFVELISEEINVPVDSIIVAHFGTFWEWELAQDSAGAYIIDTVAGVTVSTNWLNHYFDKNHYDDTQEHFLDFRLRINGEDVCNAPRYPFMRQKQSTYMTGTLITVAGLVKVSVDVRMYRNNLGKREASTGFYANIKNRNLVIQAKKR